MPRYVSHCCYSFALWCGFWLSCLLLLWVVMISMASENSVRHLWNRWVNAVDKLPAT